MDESKIQSHPLVSALQPDPSKPPVRTVKLVGLPGKSSEAGVTRLWMDADLVNYADIPDTAVLHSQTLPDNGGTILWVAADAKITHGSTRPTTAHDFLYGDIASTHFAGAQPVGPSSQGVPHPNAVTIAAPCPTIGVHCLPSLLAPCSSIRVPCIPQTIGPPCPPHVSVAAPCLSHHVPCISITPCHTLPVVCHSVATPCVSLTPICHPTGPAVCLSVLTACQSHNLLCAQSPICPTHICPSVQFCPSGVCPSLACGGPQQGGGI